MTRLEFEEELDFVERRVELLFGEVEHAVQRAVTAVIEDDETLARDTIKHDDLIDELTLSTEEAVIRTIALQAPVAGDLRYLLSVMTIAGDLERCGDLALRVAKQVFDREWIGRADHLRPLIRRLGDAALATLRMSAQAWSDRDGDAYEAIEASDLDVDALYADFLEEVGRLQGPRTGEIAVRSHIAAQALERIADHAVAIGHRIRFYVKGEHEGLADEIAP